MRHVRRRLVRQGSIEDVLSGRAQFHVACERAETFLSRIPDGSVSLIAIDPPYHRTKRERWDKEHSTASSFLEWFGEQCTQWRRVLAPNGSIYTFASVTMGARVEVEMRRHFHVLCNIRWRKPLHTTRAEVYEKEALRAPFMVNECIIFAEQIGTVSRAGEIVGGKCDELRGKVFEPIRTYLDGERKRAGLTRHDLHLAWSEMRGTKGNMPAHWLIRTNWKFPTEAHYNWLRQVLNAKGGSFLSRPYAELCDLYKSLRAQFEQLRRPFAMNGEKQFTDVWEFPTVPRRRGRHPCEKPFELMAQIITTSSRPGDIVLDCFSGSGSTGEAALANGRRFLGCDADSYWASETERRCREASPRG